MSEWTPERIAIDRNYWGQFPKEASARKIMGLLDAIESQRAELEVLRTAASALRDEFPLGSRGYLTAQQQRRLRDLNDVLRSQHETSGEDTE